MGGWFEHAVMDPGRLPLFCFFCAMVLGFVGIRISTRLIRAQVRWWPGNVDMGGVHVHHAVFGVVMMLLGGVVGLAVPVDLTGWRAVAAGLFGLGAALVLDEFALILRLEDVYWTAEGRTSVDAVFVAIALVGFVLMGVRPAGLDDFLEADNDGSAAQWVVGFAVTGFNLALATITILKGKVLTGLLGLFFPILIMVGAVRLARPHSPWARWRYRATAGEPSRKLERAQRRERRLRGPVSRFGTRLGDLVAGRPDPGS